MRVHQAGSTCDRHCRALFFGGAEIAPGGHTLAYCIVPMSASGHDSLVRRLAMILIKLNQDEKLDPSALAEEFNVNLRTIQRDLNERFAYLPLERGDGRYFLNPVFLGKLSTRDVAQFASLAGVRGLFPALSDDFLRDIFDSRVESALLVKGHHYEDLRDRDRHFWQIERAIVARLSTPI